MRRFALAATALLLLLLGAQAVLAAQYGSTGALHLSIATGTTGSTIDVAGVGFDPGATVQVTIDSTFHLETTTANGAGDIAVTITIPAGFDGSHQLVATGLDPEQSVMVLAGLITIGDLKPPATDTLPQAAPAGGSDLTILALSGAGIVLLTAGVLFVTRRRAIAS
jgi:hypothetical protein